VGNFKLSNVVIIGGGIIGLCSALELAEQGASVTVINHGPPVQDVNPRGASLGNAGMIVPSHFSPMASPGMLKLGMKLMTNPSGPFAFGGLSSPEVLSWVYHYLRSANEKHVERTRETICQLNLASRQLYGGLAKRLNQDIGFYEDGLLMICRTEEGLRHEEAEISAARQLGLKASLLTSAEVQNLNPGFRVESVGAVHFHDDAQVTPTAVIRGLLNRLQTLGVTVLNAERINRFTRKNGRLLSVATTNHTFEADQFVLAAGAWSGRIAEKLGLEIPVIAGKGYGFSLRNEAHQPGVCAILTEDRVAVSPMLDGIRFTGVMEIGPVGEKINHARLNGVIAAVRNYFPEVSVSHLNDDDVWVGNRPVSPDGLPFMGRPSMYENLTVATGHGMMGMSLGPISGRLIRQIVLQQVPEISLDLMHPDRFGKGLGFKSVPIPFRR
jgi:D-amino-acid dehydrogenase